MKIAIALALTFTAALATPAAARDVDALHISALWRAAERFCEDDQFRLISIPFDYWDNTPKSKAEWALENAEVAALENKAARDRRAFCEEAYATLGPSGKSWMFRKQPVKVDLQEKEKLLRFEQLAEVAETYCNFAVDGLALNAYLRQHGVNYSDQEPKGDYAQLLASAALYYANQARSDRKTFCADAYAMLGARVPMLEGHHGAK